MKLCAIYKYVKNGEVVYVGKSDNNVPGRVRGHSKEEKFRPFIDSSIFVAQCKNPAHMNILEKLLINYYKPILNVADKYGDDLDIVIPTIKWTPYEEFLDMYAMEKSIKKMKRVATKRSWLNDVVAQSSDVDIKKMRDAISTEIESELEIMGELAKLYMDTGVITLDIGFKLHEQRVNALTELRDMIGVNCVHGTIEAHDQVVRNIRTATEIVDRYESGILSRVRRKLKRKQAIDDENKMP